MIILGNPEFSLGMKLSGIKKSYAIKNREQGLELIKKLDKEELVLANVSVIEILPELKEFKNMVSLQDDVKKFEDIEDLKHIVKLAVGMELEI